MAKLLFDWTQEQALLLKQAGARIATEDIGAELDRRCKALDDYLLRVKEEEVHEYRIILKRNENMDERLKSRNHLFENNLETAKVLRARIGHAQQVAYAGQFCRKGKPILGDDLRSLAESIRAAAGVAAPYSYALLRRDFSSFFRQIQGKFFGEIVEEVEAVDELKAVLGQLGEKQSSIDGVYFHKETSELRETVSELSKLAKFVRKVARQIDSKRNSKTAAEFVQTAQQVAMWGAQRKGGMLELQRLVGQLKQLLGKGK